MFKVLFLRKSANGRRGRQKAGLLTPLVLLLFLDTQYVLTVTDCTARSLPMLAARLRGSAMHSSMPWTSMSLMATMIGSKPNGKNRIGHNNPVGQR